MAKRTELICDIQELEEVLKAFQFITKTRIVVFDDNFRKIIAYPENHLTYCEALRRTESVRLACIKSDLEGCTKCKEIRGIYQYTCHAGMQEVVLPLWDGDIIIGYLMLGQIAVDEKGEGREKKWDTLSHYAQKYHVDLEMLKKWYDTVELVSEERLAASIKIMETCASHLHQKGAIRLETINLSKKIAEYLEAHFNEEITLDEICSEFGMGRTKLYQVMEHSFGKGFREEIRMIRIRKAKEMLKETDTKIYEIAESIGYPDYNYFTKVFKKETGMTPREYRKNFWKEQ